MTHYIFRIASKITTEEIQYFLITSIIAGFILSLKAWGTTIYQFLDGFTNFVFFTIVFIVLQIVFIYAQKIFAAFKGYECSYKIWLYGPAIGLLISFISYGWIPFLYLGTVELKPINRFTLGKFRGQHIRTDDLMLVGLAGPIAVYFVMLLLVPLYIVTGIGLIKTILVVGAAIIFFSSLPLPRTNGINVILYSRTGWLIYFIFSLMFLALIAPLNAYAYVVAVILTIIVVWLIKKYWVDYLHSL